MNTHTPIQQQTPISSALHHVLYHARARGCETNLSKQETANTRASHPMIGLLAGELYQINLCITKLQPKAALRGLLNIMDLIAPAHRDEDLLKQLTWKAFPGIGDRATSRQLKSNLELVSKHRRAVMAILWKHGYFSETAYKFRDLSGGQTPR
jgi:hypothetical protein